MERLGFLLYLVFTASWFLHLTARFPPLGAIRFDLVLVAVIVIIYLLAGERKKYEDNRCYRRLILLIIAIIVAIPFSEWPGTVLRFGIERFTKAVVFFFFTIWFVTTEKRLKLFTLIFVSCQSIRILEPLYLHVTKGYWGSLASMANWEYMNRLSGSPYDVINPNGLAFVILTILAFLLGLFRDSKLWKILALTVVPPSLYALYLTGSRSGMVGLVVLLIILLYQSKRKILIGAIMTVGSFVCFSAIQGDYRDRYLSLVESDTKNAGTVEGRITGMIDDFKVGLRRPVFGHGLGTSVEANANYGTRAQISHNIYTETFQEIGIVGLTFFTFFAWTIVITNLKFSRIGEGGFLVHLSRAVFVFSIMNLFFGLASYGLSGYEWYLIGGLSVVIHESQRKVKDEKARPIGGEMAGGWDQNFHTLCVPKS
jgi:putative inorganic carbon (hco3(-)) transporter